MKEEFSSRCREGTAFVQWEALCATVWLLLNGRRTMATLRQRQNRGECFCEGSQMLISTTSVLLLASASLLVAKLPRARDRFYLPTGCCLDFVVSEDCSVCELGRK